MAYLLDTTVLIDALRGRSAADRLLRMRTTQEVPYICAINAEEIARGMRAEEEARTVAFLAAFRTVRLTAEHGITAGAWRRDTPGLLPQQGSDPAVTESRSLSH